MKKYLLPLFSLFLFTTQANAQLTANAGADRTFCQYDTLVLGGSPSATGGTGPYTYLWTPATWLQTNNNIANPVTTPGTSMTYTLIVTDNLGAKDTDYVTVSMFSQVTVYIGISDTSVCGGQPVTFNAQIQSGTPPFIYNWSFGDGGNANTSTAPHAYFAPGYYTPAIYITDSNGCQAEAYLWSTSITVWQPIISISATNASCFGGSDGSILGVVTGGHPPYTYMWSNGSTVQNMGNVPAGTYMLTVVDGMGCSATATATVLQPTQIVANPTVTNESAIGACDGAIVFSVAGGTPAYNFNWGGGITTATRTNLCSGTYTATITDANGCTVIGTGVVTGSCLNNTLVVSINSQDLSCAHPTDTMTVNVTGGTQPYNFQWNTGDVNSQITVSQAGVYMIYVTDDSGCVQTAVDTLLNLGLNIALEAFHPVSCNGNPDGSLSVTVTGGTPPYTYLWSNNATTDSLTGIVSALYTVTVTDAVLCTASFEYFVNQNSTNYSYYAYVNSTNSNCSTGGTATATVYGGTGPYTYLWSTTPPQTTATATGLTGGYYYVTVTGNDGCMRTGYTYIYTTCNNIIQGYVFNDANGNCVKDSGETNLSNVSVVATGSGVSYYGYSGYNGLYNIQVGSSGNFDVTASPYSSYGGCSNVVVCGTQTASFPSLGDTAVLNFGFGVSSGFNLNVHPGWHSANPGFVKDYWVLYNQSSLPAYTGPATIVFKYDPILVFNSCNNSGTHNAIAHTITWNVASVPYSSWNWSTVPRAYFTVPANTPVGYQLSQEFWLTPTVGDCDSSNNHLVCTQPVTGSMDPNEKEVSPAGDIQEEDSVLTYTIHFQNTGNDTTAFIIIKDTLSSYLNPVTVQNIASSHEYTSFDISGTGVLTWLFNPIFLVDSFTNEPASKGFVSFRIKKKAGLPLNTQIANHASIYFDYNEAVVTNTVISKLTDPNGIRNITNDASIQVAVAPNPFTHQTQITVEGTTGAFNFELFDVSGKLLKKINAQTGNRFTINREGMSAGIYFYSITTNTKQKAFGRLVVE